MRFPLVTRRFHDAVKDRLEDEARLAWEDGDAAHRQLVAYEVEAFNKAKESAVVKEVSANLRTALRRVKDLEGTLGASVKQPGRRPDVS